MSYEDTYARYIEALKNMNGSTTKVDSLRAKHPECATLFDLRTAFANDPSVTLLLNTAVMEFQRVAEIEDEMIEAGWLTEGERTVPPGRPERPPTATTTLFHRTSRANANNILATGFEDRCDTYMTADEHCGVWFSDRPLDSNEGANGDTLLTVEFMMVGSELEEFEWVEEGKPYREFLIPAVAVNIMARVVRTEFDPGLTEEVDFDT